MKKLLSVLIIAIFVLGFQNKADAAAANARIYDTLTGNCATCLDKTAIAGLTNGDIAFVREIDGDQYNYIFVSASTEAENSPWYIRPDDYSTAGVWVLDRSVTYMPTASPCIVLRDSDGVAELPTDNHVTICAALTDTGDGTEDADLVVTSFVAGTATELLRIDADGNFEVALDVDVATGKVYKINGVQLKDVDRDIWKSVGISVAGMIADGTNCLDPASEAINSGPNVWFSTCSDAAGTLEFGIPMPENWDGGNIYLEMLAGSNEGSPSGTVEFEVSTMARGNDDLINNTWVTGDNVQFASNIDTQYDLVIAESDVIAAAGAGGDLLLMKITRDNDDGANDTSTQAVEVWGARLYYQIDDEDERD